MKRKMIGAFLVASLLLCGAAYAETEEETRIALQEKLQQLEETYGDELSAQDHMQLNLIHDWADRYVQNSEWERFAEELDQCKDAKALSEWLGKDYIGITQAPEGQMQREEIRQRTVDIIQSAGLDQERVPYISIGNKGVRADGSLAGWWVIASELPGEERATPHVEMEFAGDGKLQYMESELAVKEASGADVTAEQAEEIAAEFLTRYVYPASEEEKSDSAWEYMTEEKDSYWEVTCQSQTDERHCTMRIEKKTGSVYFAETDTRG